MDQMETNIDQMGTNMDQMGTKMDQMRTDLGDVYELSARLEIAKMQGSNYTSKFEVFDAFGLVRLALPRKGFPSEKMLYSSQAHVLSSRANKLANYIYVRNIKYHGVGLFIYGSYLM